MLHPIYILQKLYTGVLEKSSALFALMEYHTLFSDLSRRYNNYRKHVIYRGDVMTTLHLTGLSNLLHPGRDKRSAVSRITDNLATSNWGTTKSTGETNNASALDTFSITQNISELLSPACGMTDEEKEAYFAKIMAKLKSGKKLTPEEMRFLQAENPELYQQAARVQTMRESLENRLAHATSKEDAASIYTDALSHISDKDPMKEYLVAAYDDAMKEFKKSDVYESLPNTEKDREEKKE